LTKTNTLIHDPACHDPACHDADIANLRQRLAALDVAILACYGLDDLDLEHDFHANVRGQPRFGGAGDQPCARWATAFAGWKPENATAFLATLSNDARTALHPDHNVLANALAHPAWREPFRQAGCALAALPPSTALPAFQALTALQTANHALDRRNACTELAQALRDHGQLFVDIAGALDDTAQAAVLPHLSHPHDRSALEPLAATDPLVAHRLAHALLDNNPSVDRTVPATAPPQEVRRIWQLLPDTIRSAVLGDGDSLLYNVAALERADDVAQALRACGTDVAQPLLVLRMRIDADEKRRPWGATMLAQRPDVAAALLPRQFLREDVRALLAYDLQITVASADLPLPRSPAPAPVTTEALTSCSGHSSRSETRPRQHPSFCS
jgi:hypothetical protein